MQILPIIIPTLCRDVHFVKCIESLKKNGWAKVAAVYVVLDYPCKENHWNGYRKIKEYLEGDFSQFAEFHVIYRTENYGVGRNISPVLLEIRKNYDRYVVSEDDNEFSQNFIEYMYKTLEYYKDDESVLAVTGYTYPLDYLLEEGTSVFLENAVFSMWGTGFWSKKYERVIKEIKEERYLVKNFKYAIKSCRFSDSRRADYITYAFGTDMNSEDNIITKMTDIALGIYMQIKGMYQVMPIVSKVRNNGFDGSGVYCQRITVNNQTSEVRSDTYDYSNQPIDKKENFYIKISNQDNKERIFQIMDKFTQIDKKRQKRVKIMYILYSVLGEKNCVRIKKLKKLIKP